MTFCTIQEAEEFQVLKDVMNLQRGRRLEASSKLLDKSEKLAEKRWEEAQKRLKKYEELLRRLEQALFYQALDALLYGKSVNDVADNITGNEQRQRLREEISSLEGESNEITGRDLVDVLREYERRGYIDMQRSRVRITSQGARILGQGFLRRILENLSKNGVGIHRIEKVGHGPYLSRLSRRYELGDVYERINIERTLLNALERNRRLDQLTTEDFEVYEALHVTKMNVGIIIDESGSMNYRNKIEAAIETALALAELMRNTYSEDTLRIFTFSEHVKEIPLWEVPNIRGPMRYTDIKAGLRAYRRAVAHEEGDKQAFLITDSEPNFQDGRYVGVHRASLRVLREASHYRRDGITLNLIMLDRRPHLKDLASMIAQRNLGRVVFVNPRNLSEAIIEDYLTTKREKLRS